MGKLGRAAGLAIASGLAKKLERMGQKQIAQTLVAFGLVVFLLFNMAWAVFVSGSFLALDTGVASFLFTFRSLELSAVFSGLTLLGSWQIIGSLAVFLSVFFMSHKKRIYILLLWITIIGSEAGVFWWKLLFHRPRPGLAYSLENSFSFPSGHSALAMAFYGFMVYIIWREAKKRRYKITVALVGSLLILAIGFSRLYLGEHFLSDVLAGWLLGLGWLIIGIGSEQFIRKKPVS